MSQKVYPPQQTLTGIFNEVTLNYETNSTTEVDMGYYTLNLPYTEIAVSGIVKLTVSTVSSGTLACTYYLKVIDNTTNNVLLDWSTTQKDQTFELWVFINTGAQSSNGVFNILKFRGRNTVGSGFKIRVNKLKPFLTLSGR